MTITVRGRSDDVLRQLATALGRYQAEHPNAEIAVARQNSAAVRVRIVDPDFAGMDRVDRHERAWSYLAALPEAVLSQVTMLLLLLPEEQESSFANREFEHPVRSGLP